MRELNPNRESQQEYFGVGPPKPSISEVPSARGPSGVADMTPVDLLENWPFPSEEAKRAYNQKAHDMATSQTMVPQSRMCDCVHDERQCSVPVLLWSSEPPTEPGWYWHRDHNGASVEILLMKDRDGLMYPSGWMNVSLPRGLWAGPLEHPRD